MSVYGKTVEEIKYKNYTIEVYYDEDPRNPRTEWDNLCTMLCAHQRYTLGDEQVRERWGEQANYFSGWQEIVDKLQKEEDVVMWRRLKLYDHSGITISMSESYPYNDRWDSMTVGIIYVTREHLKSFMGWKRMNKKRTKQLHNIMEGEVQTYDNYLTGNVYGYAIVDPAGEEIGACWGFFGDYNEYMVKDCKEIIDNDIKYQKSNDATVTSSKKTHFSSRTSL